MSLTNRLSAFALTGLVLVLVGFSVTLFLLARHHLIHRTDLRLNTAMETLVAAVEVHPNDVEWEPLQRRITLGDDPADDQIRWMVHDETGQLVDCSRNLDTPARTFGFDNQTIWHFQIVRISAGRFQADDVAAGTRVFGDGEARQLDLKLPGIPLRLPEDRTRQARAFTLTSAIPWRPVESSLWLVAWVLMLVSTVIWTIAAFLGRWVCRRALAPVTKMAGSARLLKAGVPSLRLQVGTSGDELEELGSAFNDLLARLQAAFERQERFTGDAAHQLRTPLTAVLGQVEVALRHRRSEEEYRKVLEVVQRRSLQLRQIIDALLFLARADELADIPDMQELDVEAWLRTFVAEWKDHPRGQDIQLVCQGRSCLVRAHPDLLKQVFDNLLGNACKYSKPGTSIDLFCHADSTGVELMVQDQGCGIPAEDIPHVCEPFFRSPLARQGAYQGIGLGLAIVGRIVTILAGRLGIASEPGRGSRFTVWLPRVLTCGTTQERNPQEYALPERTGKDENKTELINLWQE